MLRSIRDCNYKYISTKPNALCSRGKPAYSKNDE